MDTNDAKTGVQPTFELPMKMANAVFKYTNYMLVKNQLHSMFYQKHRKA